jgi:glycosyltransferase involved in cell wall biosynthesis
MRGVSLIMPVYHAGNRSEEIDHFCEALDSVVALTLSARMPPFELIIVDDASKNSKTKKIVDEYSSRYPWIKTIFNTENHGPSYARNRAIEMSNFDFIAGIDADDILPRSAINFFTTSIDQMSVNKDICYFYPRTRQFGHHNSLGFFLERPTEREVALIGYAPASAVYRKNDVIEAGMCREDSCKAEDRKLGIDVMAMRWRKGMHNQVILSSEISYYYRQYNHGENVNARPLSMSDLYKFLVSDVEDFFQAKVGISDPEQLTAMNHSKFRRILNSSMAKAVFNSFIDNPRATCESIILRSRRVKKLFNQFGLNKIPDDAHVQSSRRLELT